VAYLNAGVCWRISCGVVPCYAEVCTGGGRSRAEVTDGVWVWPSELAHYIVEHDVCLPDAFLETMRRNGWRAPGEHELRPILDEWWRNGTRPSFSVWKEWARQVSV
jgi:hypothetical protein